jgi:hypothetical protein
MITKAVSAEQKTHKITAELQQLAAELASLQGRAFPIVEELDNWQLENGLKFPGRRKSRSSLLSCGI